MSKWFDIKQKMPEEGQPVWYYFDVADNVYDGFYNRDDVSSLYNEPEGTYFSNCFHGRHGWLCDDVTYWTPREEGQDKPDKPVITMEGK